MAAAISAIVVADVVTVAMVAEAVTAVGLITTAVGMITKNKTLTEIGGVMALAGGVGGLAAGAAEGVAAEGALAMDGTDSVLADGATSADIGSSVAGDTTMSSAAPVAGDPIAGMNDLNGWTGANPVEPTTVNTSIDTPLDGTSTSTSPGTSASTPNGSNTPTPTPTSTATPTSTPTPTSTANASNLASPTDTKDPGWFEKWYSSLTPGQGKVVAGAMQVGGSALSGLMSGWSAEQKLALEQQAQNLASTKYNQSVANASAQPKISYAPVTPAAPATGLINTPTPKVG